MRWVGVIVALIGAAFFGVPFIVWLVVVAPDKAQLAVAAIGLVGVARILWPESQERNGTVVMPERRYDYDAREEMERLP